MIMKRLLFLLLLIPIGLFGQRPIVSTNVSYATEYSPPGFPQIESGTAIGQETVNATSHSITMPTNVQSGELILALIGIDGTEEPVINTGVSGNNWTIEDSDNTSNTGQVIWKIAEGSNALTLTTTNSEKCGFIVYRINYFLPADPVKSTHATGSTINANPPSNTGDYGAVNYLWITCAITNDATIATSAPTDFSNLLTTPITTSSAPVNTSDREFNTGVAYDPGNFTNTVVAWLAITIIVNPL